VSVFCPGRDIAGTRETHPVFRESAAADETDPLKELLVKELREYARESKVSPLPREPRLRELLDTGRFRLEFAIGRAHFLIAARSLGVQEEAADRAGRRQTYCGGGNRGP
jgi:hypothetical protein